MNNILNHITIVISTRNSERWIEKSIKSACIQNYPIEKFDILFFDADSTDNTFLLAKKFEESFKNFKAFKNDKRKYQGENILMGTKMAKEKSIICHLDGDDWYRHEDVLTRINLEYVKHNCLLTHGSYIEYHGENQPLVSVSWNYHAYPKDIIENKKFRQYKWLGSHLRSHRRELLLNVKENDLKDELTGDFVSMAPDLSFMWYMMELAGNKIRFIPDELYVYNRANENNESKQNQAEIDRIEKQLRNRTPYLTLEKLYENE